MFFCLAAGPMSRLWLFGGGGKEEGGRATCTEAEEETASEATWRRGRAVCL